MRSGWQRGFSFVELLATLALLGLLASVALPLAENTLRRNKEQLLRRNLRDIRMAIDAYKKAADEGRIAVRQGESGYPPTLDSLVLGAADAKQPFGKRVYFMRSLPRDPFANDSKVTASATWGLRSFDSPPDTPRAGADVFDVYSQSNGTGLNGVPYKEW